MDIAYDHIQETNYPTEEEARENATKKTEEQQTLNQEFQEAYKAVANSPWAATVGGWWGSVKKQGEQYYEEAQKINTVATEQATKGFGDLISRARALSLAKQQELEKGTQDTEATEGAASTEKSTDEVTPEHPDRPESLTADIVKEAGTILSRFQAEAKRRLKDIEKAEDAADEALLRFGNNLKSFLADAVSIAPPTEFVDASQPDKVLFESKDLDGKRVIHTTRLDAQLHVIHCSLDSFLKDPAGKEWDEWKEKFDADTRADDISKDLDKYPELRRAMEKIMPEQVDFVSFWRRYYFLRGVAELEEQRRKELLKGAASNANEEVGWDSDDDEDSNTPNASRSTTTLERTNADKRASAATLKPDPPRKSNDEKSVADSDASYDVVSGATSRTHGSPRVKTVDEESDEDWE